MKINNPKNLNLFAAVTIAVALFAGCQKDANTSKPAAADSPNLSGLAAAQGGTPFYISNCGVATLPPPVAGNGTSISHVGTILAVNQPVGEAPIPSSIVYGPNVIIGNAPTGIPKYRLTLQGDANLVLYLNGTTTSLWSSRSQTSGANTHINCYMILQGDGNLVLQDRLTTGGLSEYWASHDVICPGQAAPVLIFQSDGNIVEEYPVAAHNGANSYGFVGNTGTGGGGNKSNHPGKF